MNDTFEAVLDKFDSPLWTSHIRIPSDIAHAFISAGAKRVVCTINGIHSYQCAIMPNGDDYFFILVNKPTVKKLKIDFGQVLTIEIKKDESEFGLPLPEEMDILLKEDPEFDHYFRKLTPGKQRNLLYLVGQPKTSDTRIKKLMAVVDHLKANGGKLDFKMLYEAMKG